MIKDIINYEIEILNNMNYFVNQFKIINHYANGIVYHLDVNNTHIAIFQDWERKFISMQFFSDEFIQVKKEFINFDDIHGIIVNEICSRINK